MTALLNRLLDLSVLVFGVASMLSVGLGHALREVIEPLRNVRGVVRALIANFLLVPLLAVVVVRLFALDPPIAIGLVLVSMAAGAPFLIQLTARADHDVGFSASMLLLLLPATIVFMPIAVPILVPEAVVSAGAIARPLIYTMLVPLGIGFVVNTQRPRWAERLLPVARIVSSVSLVALILLTVLLNWRGMVALLGTGAILAAVIVIAGAFVIGYTVGGGRTQETRGILGLATAQRNIAAATVVATQTFEDPGELIMVVVTSLVAMALLFPIASLLRRRMATQE